MRLDLDHLIQTEAAGERPDGRLSRPMVLQLTRSASRSRGSPLSVGAQPWLAPQQSVATLPELLVIDLPANEPFFENIDRRLVA